MGFAIAERLASLGAQVYLVAGPVNLEAQNPNIQRIDVTSAQEMHDVCMDLFSSCNGAVMVAAVADFAPEIVADEKIKRSGENVILKLRPNPDIAASLGKTKRPDQILAGFALETQNEEKNAQGKLKKKNLDFIVLNSLREEGSGFQYDTNKIKIIDINGEVTSFELKTKKEVAVDIVNKLIELQDTLPTFV
jgi:phosphopantothenoylcysteine decarboxylase/phosphopantothenate--cysteine ligase